MDYKLLMMTDDAEKKSNSDEHVASDEALVAGRDYYVERGYMVFTEYYLKHRGYCCNSGCRHCPYG